jgi:hypothetical protein
MFNDVKDAMEKKNEKLSKERDAVCIPIARHILKMMAEKELVVATSDFKTIDESYRPLTSEILGYLLEQDIKVDYINYIFRLVGEMWEQTKNYTIESVNKSLNIAQRIHWGKEPNDVTMKDLDKILLSEKTIVQ